MSNTPAPRRNWEPRLHTHSNLRITDQPRVRRLWMRMTQWWMKKHRVFASLCLYCTTSEQALLTVRQTEESITLGDLKKLFGGITAPYMGVGKQKTIQVVNEECVWVDAVWPVWVCTHSEQHHAIVITAPSRLLQASWLLENNLHSAGQIIAE